MTCKKHDGTYVKEGFQCSGVTHAVLQDEIILSAGVCWGSETLEQPKASGTLTLQSPTFFLLLPEEKELTLLLLLPSSKENEWDEEKALICRR